MQTDGQADVTELRVAFRKSAKAPKNCIDKLTFVEERKFDS